MSVFEKDYKDDLTEEEAIDLVDRAIQAGVFNDLGSGSNVDICVISKHEKQPRVYHNYKSDLNVRSYKRKAGYNFPKGTTEWLLETKKIFAEQIVVEDAKSQEDRMEMDE